MPDALNLQVVLIMPRLLAPAISPGMMAELIKPGDMRVRCIVRADDEAELRYAEETVARAQVDVLWCGTAPPPACTSLEIVCMLPGAQPDDADMFALAMCDALLSPDRARAEELFTALKRSSGRDMRSNVVDTVTARPAVGQAPRPTRLLALDPRMPRIDYTRRTIQLLEAAGGYCDSAFVWMARHFAPAGHDPTDPVEKPPEPLPLCSDVDNDALPPQDPDSPTERCKAYFGPKDWTCRVPDRKAGGPHTSAMLALFRKLDRAAAFGARVQRDIIVMSHVLAALAVFAAVSGILHLRLRLLIVDLGWWALVELLLLILVLVPVAFARKQHLQKRWMACRLAAEQIRIGYMCLAVMVLPPVLLLNEKPRPRSLSHGEEEDLRGSAITLAKRALREYGLPRGGNELAPAISWVRAIVQDQYSYHRGNRDRLTQAEHGLTRFVQSISIIVVAAVGVHVLLDPRVLQVVPGLTHTLAGSAEGIGHHWLIAIVSAGGPALAAALHGIGTRLDLVHRGDLSRDAALRLAELDAALSLLDIRQPEQAGDQFRDLTLQAAEAMNSETEQWHRLSLLQPLSLPA